MHVGLTIKVYWTATAQKPNKQLKLDFFYVHAVNLSILMRPILDPPTLSVADKVRLLEMKGRIDLLIWASRKMPTPQEDDIHAYPSRLGWPEIFEKSYKHSTDDGHLAKFVRTVAYAQDLCAPYEKEAKQRGLKVTGDMWLKIGNMGKTGAVLSRSFNVSLTLLSAVDTAGERFSDIWVRGAGFDEPWAKFGPRK